MNNGLTQSDNRYFGLFVQYWIESFQISAAPAHRADENVEGDRHTGD